MNQNIDKKTAIISLEENATYYVKKGKLIRVDDLPKGYGSQTVVWKKGEPQFVDISYTAQCLAE